ncbi:MAG: rotamase, partial [Brevundimonas sp.]
VQQSQASQTELGEGVLRGLFGQGKGQVFTGQTQTGFVVGSVDGIHGAVPALAAPLVEQVRPRLTQELANAMVETSFNAAAARVKAKNDPAAALVALGIETPAAAPAAPAAPAPAKK